jgi:hypothetical protein
LNLLKIKFLVVFFLACSLTLAAVAGCGKSPSTKPPMEDGKGETKKAQELIDPRSLITEAEAEAALGEAIGEVVYDESNNPLGQKLVCYNSASSYRFIQISLIQTAAMTAAVEASGQTAATIYQTTKENLDAEEIPGFGDDAFWGTPGLHILKGDVYLNIAVGNTDDPKNLEMAKTLAGLAVPRLP